MRSILTLLITIDPVFNNKLMCNYLMAEKNFFAQKKILFPFFFFNETNKRKIYS